MNGRRGLGLELVFLAFGALLFLSSSLGRWSDPLPWTPSPRTPELLRVLTWNVGNGLDRGGGGLEDRHLEAVVETLREVDPDLAFLQELTTLGRLENSKVRTSPAFG